MRLIFKLLYMSVPDPKERALGLAKKMILIDNQIDKQHRKFTQL